MKPLSKEELDEEERKWAASTVRGNIDRLIAQARRAIVLREALERVAKPVLPEDTVTERAEIARAALEGKDG